LFEAKAKNVFVFILCQLKQAASENEAGALLGEGKVLIEK
jgi:hypothetical protein